MNLRKSIEKELTTSYLAYSMSVIISRALPNVKDGLKPVQKRILYAMYQLGYFHNKPTRKSASVVGYVQQKFHPHGDSSIYDALVRMAQDFSLLMPLIDGQGNFGSIDGDSAAAMRYTEVRMQKLTDFLLKDIEYETVDYVPNYDGSELEPVIFPARFPNILINGSSGIAVGMATNIPSHNLNEVMNALIEMTQNPNMTLEEVMQYIQGPDFSSYGEIINKHIVRSIYETGRGIIQLRGKIDSVKEGNKERLIIREIPYAVNKAKLVERIASLVNDKIIEGVSDLRDESNLKEGIRVVIDLKKNANIDVIINQLWQYTPLQTSFGVNMLVIDEGMPKQMNLVTLLQTFITFRESVISRRTAYLLRNSSEKIHLLIGLTIAVSNIDEIIAMIKSSKDTSEAKDKLKSHGWRCDDILPMIKLLDEVATNHLPFSLVNPIEGDIIYLTEAQAKGILEMRLSKLTSLEKNKIKDELDELFADIREYIEILTQKEKLYGIMRDEFKEVRDAFSVPRRTIFSQVKEIDDESLIPNEEIVIVLTMNGYIKRVPIEMYKNQKRGGTGKSGAQLHEDDFIRMLFSSNTHTNLLFFSSVGKVYKLKAYKLPLGNLSTKGKNIVNILPLANNEKITNVIPVNDLNQDDVSILFATSHGNIRRNSLSVFSTINSNGKIAIKFEEGTDEELISVQLAANNSLILLSTRQGKSILFEIDSVRSQISRSSVGVRGMKLKEDDRVQSMSILSTEENYILSITAKGYGQRCLSSDYRITNRGGTGIINMTLRSKDDSVIDSCIVNPEEDDLIVVTDNGQIIRFAVTDVKVTHRTSKGVICIRLKAGEQIKSVTVVKKTKIEEEN